MSNIFKKHPKSAGETYFLHFAKAMSFGIRLLVLSYKSFVHAIFPFIYVDAISSKIKELNDQLQQRKNKQL
jgi:hypothetical protein